LGVDSRRDDFIAPVTLVDAPLELVVVHPDRQRLGGDGEDGRRLICILPVHVVAGRNRGGRREKKNSREKRARQEETKRERSGVRRALAGLYKPRDCRLPLYARTLDLGAGVSPGVLTMCTALAIGYRSWPEAHALYFYQVAIARLVSSTNMRRPGGDTGILDGEATAPWGSFFARDRMSGSSRAGRTATTQIIRTLDKYLPSILPSALHGIYLLLYVVRVCMWYVL